jgi:hypothetical protein
MSRLGGSIATSWRVLLSRCAAAATYKQTRSAVTCAARITHHIL